jgi:hypothetical protein
MAPPEDTQDIVLGNRWLAALTAAPSAAPGFSRALALAAAEPLPGTGWPALLERLCGVPAPAVWQPAAFSWVGEAAVPGEAPAGRGLDFARESGGAQRWIWRADPVHLTAGLDSLHLALAGPALAVETAETEALVDALNAHFATEGLVFSAPAPARWYLHADGPIDAHTEATAAVLGGSIHEALPAGPDGRRLAALMNEIQMLLGMHEVNLRREARGRPPVNGLWCWGGGPAPLQASAKPSGGAGLPRLLSTDPVLAGWWHLAGVREAPIPPLAEPPEHWLVPARGRPQRPIDARAGRLVVLDDDVPLPPGGEAAAASMLERAWQQWRRGRPLFGRGAGVRVAAAGRLFVLSARAPWWRRRVSLATRLAATEGAAAPR